MNGLDVGRRIVGQQDQVLTRKSAHSRTSTAFARLAHTVYDVRSMRESEFFLLNYEFFNSKTL